ncbi:RNA-directed DNA polymerase [Niabella aurantiaca]|uniref:RNA-directed DNA polymerase n=1 Tax=Niabella aurantiaca TaxID=379900 RepID=UPI00036AB400|nr:RNA-directed DNA polymerase [Niabella aurantiaca]
MTLTNITEVKTAYKKLKSYVYHENFSLPLRISLAEYEGPNIAKKLEKLVDEINAYAQNPQTGIFRHYKSIRASLMPKNFEDNKGLLADEAFYFSNANKLREYVIEKETPFILCPIEIHIVSILWIMKIGHKLDEKLSFPCYGNRLLRNYDNQFEENSIKLFRKYFISYNNWRDDAIKKAKGLHQLNLDVAILSLDLKSYYNSIDLDFASIRDIDPEFNWLNNFLQGVHIAFSKLLEDENLIEQKGKRIIPIGLISSNILANYYLKDFDDAITQKVKPEFYGRYVDDIMFVVSNPKIFPESPSPVNSFIDQFLVDNGIWGRDPGVAVEKNGANAEYHIKIGKNALPFQIKKVKLYHLLASESANLLDEFEKEIKKNSSEFKFQPESKNIFESFENASYKISYSDTVNKLRSIDGFNADKLGASKHLAKLISTTVAAEKLSKERFEEINDKIVTFFSGKRSLELNALWEKVFTFYVVNAAKDELIKFAKDQIENIFRIKIRERKITAPEYMDIQASLLTHLTNCFSMAASLNIAFFNDAIIDSLRDSRYSNVTTFFFEFITIELVLKQAKALIGSNLFRHNYLYYPLLNYCVQEEGFNYLNKQLKPDKTKFAFSKRKIEYSPRFIHYHEVCLFYGMKSWFKPSELNKKYFSSQYNYLFGKYIDMNKLSQNAENAYRKFYPKEEPFAKVNDRKYEGKKIEIKAGKVKDKLKIGLVNAVIDFENSKSSLLGKPNLSFRRLDEINQLLNESLHTQKCDIIIFPEISIPFQWLPMLASFSKRNNIAICCGVEHIVNNEGFALNYVATILPFTYNRYQNALIDFRLKKDYSPEEIEEIQGRKIKIPFKEMENEQLRLYVWNDIHFSIFNCFELADIRKRAIFRGHVDFIATVEHNPDVNYFSNIIESVARDIHSYVVQVNSSHYGDSRITQPAETYRKDILKIKGGNNVSLITGTIDIAALREFQKLEYQLQKRNKIFKPTPPNFKILNSRRK